MKRRGFLQSLALGAVSSTAVESENSTARVQDKEAAASVSKLYSKEGPITYPRTFSGRQLEMLAFPLGGIGTGSISLGGRGQLRDWEIYNRPDKGRAPQYVFPSLWVKQGNDKPIAHVLEARLMPPYGGDDGLGSTNAPGLSRLEGASFTGEFPLATIDFHDARLPVKPSLKAFSPFIPLDADNSGYPAAVLRYRVRNTAAHPVTASIAFTLDNPVGPLHPLTVQRNSDRRKNEYRIGANGLKGIFMTNEGIASTDPESGSFALCVLAKGGKLSYLRGWPAAKWWASPMLFWDDFSSDGELGPEAEDRKPTASICLQREIAAHASADYTFILAWHFPNRTPAWSGWDAPKGFENTNIGNYYCTRFQDAWLAADALGGKLAGLEKRMMRYVTAMRESTLPAPVRDAAGANASTLVTQTVFRTADGEFHGFEGCNDHRGCCFGNCLHVWNYETTTHYLFPQMAHSLRKAAFGYSQDEQGGMRFRQLLPDGKERFGFAAADGQMGQIIKMYLDWQLSGDTDWLREYWPKMKLALSYAWIPGGWDASRRGVLDGVQHNTYDVEFYGPNPLCGVYYLGALRAAEEMARVVEDQEAGATYRDLYDKGRRWIDANLFNGEYYIQQVRSMSRDQIAKSTVGDMGADHPETPEFQLGDGCLADQLIGQYLADIAGLGPLLDPDHIQKTLRAIYKYNYRKNLFDHDSVQRVYALNDEPAVLVCDYGKGTRPQIPFPYFQEAWTGMEYLVGAQFLAWGMLREGLEVIENVRWRYDGERRNPWDEPECGHHYARAMSAWSSIVVLNGFAYNAAKKEIVLNPRWKPARFVSFWFTGLGWGTFTFVRLPKASDVELSVIEGKLPVGSFALGVSTRNKSYLTVDGKVIKHELKQGPQLVECVLNQPITLSAGSTLKLSL